MKRHDFISSIVLFCIGLFIIFYALQFNLGNLNSPGSGFMPFLTGLIICGFSSITFFQAFLDKSAGVEKIWAGVKFQKLISTIVMLIAYVLLIEPLGFIICSFFLILALMRYISFQSWLRSILGAGLISILSYLLFDTWFKAQLPRGIFGFLG
jgi:putative tricarboxylic transport membrane protein